MKTKCCNYEIDPARPVVMWNEFNGVVQCHNCGHVYEPALAGVELAGLDSPTWPIVLWFAGEMEKKLALNRHKGDAENWRKDSPMDLLQRCRVELSELCLALANAHAETMLNSSIAPAALLNVIKECADVANFAMMIADQAKEAMGAREAGQPTPDPSKEGNSETEGSRE